MMPGECRILLVDDHAVVCEGYRALLHTQPGLRVVATAHDGHDAYVLYKQHRPDLVILDVAMPGLGGIEAARRIRMWDGSARVLILSMYQGAAFAVQALRAGAHGYVTKSSKPELLVRAVRDVLAGRIVLSPDIAEALALSSLGPGSAADRLSPREFEIMRMLLEGVSPAEVAETLHISPKTLANTRYAIRSKLGVESDIGMVRLGIAEGILAGECRDV